MSRCGDVTRFSRLSGCSLLAVVIGIAAGPVLAQQEEGPAKRASRQELAQDDGKSAGMRSIAGSGHVVKFESPGDNHYLRSVKLFGARYGHPQPPNENFQVWLCDAEMNVLEEFEFPYKVFERGEPRWVTLDVAPTKVPATFILCFGFNPAQTKGVYVHFDGEASGSSLVGLPGKQVQPFTQGDWLIRAVVMQRSAVRPTSTRAAAEADRVDVEELRRVRPMPFLIDDTDVRRRRDQMELPEVPDDQRPWRHPWPILIDDTDILRLRQPTPRK